MDNPLSAFRLYLPVSSILASVETVQNANNLLGTV